MAGIYWLASYPKSGNTWLRFLACNLVFGEVKSAAALNQLAPDLHELGASFEPPDQPLLMKTHYRYSPQLRFAGQTAAAVYILRDPADVMVSNFHYDGRSGSPGGDRSKLFARYLDAFIAARGDPRWVRMGMGTWEENVRSWIGQQQRFPVLLVRYEELLSEGARVAGQLCQSLGITRTAAAVAAALEHSSFERMQVIEEADIRERRVGIFYKPYLQAPIEAGLRFMRAGIRGGAAQQLSEEQWGRFNAVFGALRREFGYR
jgi:hypothetical protein